MTCVVDLAFEELGNPDDAPLIILHGFFASSRNWRQVAEKLATKFHVYVPDMRNHGASPHHPVMIIRPWRRIYCNLWMPKA